MNDRKRLVHKLIVDLHINVAERHALGAVSRSEIAEMVRSLLCRDGSFPKREEAGAVNEGASLVLTPEGVDVIWERPYAWDPFTVAERAKRHFADLDTAFDAFIESQWGNGIDGIKLS